MTNKIYNNDFFKKIFKNPDKQLIDNFTNAIYSCSLPKNDFYKRNVKYTILDYVEGIIDVCKNNTSWNSYKGVVNGNTLRKKHYEWIKLGIYEYLFKNSLEKYFKKNSKSKELKYQSIDSTFIEDKNGSKKSSFSGYYKRRKGEASKGINITSIVTSSGLPISISINGANKHDSPLLPNAINKINIDCNTKKYQFNNRYKQYFLADSGYDSKNNYKLLINKGYTPIIIQNKKNIKDQSLIRKLNTKQKEIYKKRIIIENYHSWIKKFSKIRSLYERNIKSYKGLLLLCASIIINRRINN